MCIEVENCLFINWSLDVTQCKETFWCQKMPYIFLVSALTSCSQNSPTLQIIQYLTLVWFHWCTFSIKKKRSEHGKLLSFIYSIGSSWFMLIIVFFVIVCSFSQHLLLYIEYKHCAVSSYIVKYLFNVQACI